MKLGSSRGMDTKRPGASERSKPGHELSLTRRSQPPYPWPPEQVQPGVSKPCRSTDGAMRHGGVIMPIDHFALFVQGAQARGPRQGKAEFLIGWTRATSEGSLT